MYIYIYIARACVCVCILPYIYLRDDSLAADEACWRQINHLQTKRSVLYSKTQFVPRSKQFISVIKTNQFMM